MESTATEHLDARTFQVQLNELATTIAYTIQREGRLTLRPPFVVPDLYFILRQAQQTYNLFCYINADDHRKKDPDWRPAYSAVILPLIRTMIDCLYNITAILQNPGVRSYEFRESGYRLTLEALDADERRYGGDPTWDAQIATLREKLALDMRANGFKEEEVRAGKIWKTLSAYLWVKKNKPLTPHQQILKKLTFGFWQEYSGISHATFQGLLPLGIFLTPKDLPIEDRPMVETATETLVYIHLSRAAAILLCILTEIQAHCHFDSDRTARINQRLHQIWSALLTVKEIKELYDERYSRLMTEKGMNPD
jgi:hypothetical protein